MRPVMITPENLPTDTPAIIGTRYFCREWDCYTERKDLKECGAIPSEKATYTPILRCSICGRLYFGNPTPIHAEMQRAEEEQRAREHAEREAHEAKQSSDIILPQLLTV